MVNYEIMDYILSFIASKINIHNNKTFKMLFVWDHNQLPSIWTWNILKDIIIHNIIKYTKLDKVYRNNNNILLNAEKILIWEKELEHNENFNIDYMNEIVYDNNKIWNYIKDFLFIIKKTIR